MNAPIKLFGCLLLVVLLSACAAPVSTSPDVAPDQAAQDGPPDAVTVQLDWVPNHEYTGFYLADDLGYYDDANLDVTVSPVDQSGKRAIEILLAGDTDFAVAGADEILLYREQGEAIVGIMTIYQRSPIGFMSLAERNIKRPEDLIGKKVYLSMNSSSEYAFRAMMHNAGLNADDVEMINRTDWSNDMLTSGDVDVIDVWVNNQPIQVEGEGYEVNTILPFDYGVELYPDVIMTTEAMINDHPDVVQRFVEATVRGLQASIDDPDKAAEVVVALAPNLSLDFEKESMLRSIPLLLPTGSQPGMMTREGWNVTYQILLDQGILTKEMDITSAYNLSFLTEALALE